MPNEKWPCGVGGGVSEGQASPEVGAVGVRLCELFKLREEPRVRPHRHTDYVGLQLPIARPPRGNPTLHIVNRPVCRSPAQRTHA